MLVSGDSSLLYDHTTARRTSTGTATRTSSPIRSSGTTARCTSRTANFNNAVSGNENLNQILLAKSTDGGATFSTPVKVSDYYDLPDCDTYQGAGADPCRACVPEKGDSTVSVFRATNYASGAVNPTHPNQVAVTVGSYINKYSNESNGCVPAGFNADTGINRYTGVKRFGGV